MVHLKIYEEYNKIGKTTREIFNLDITIPINDWWGNTGIEIKGPIENEEKARSLIKLLQKKIYDGLIHTTVISSRYKEDVNDLLKSMEYQFNAIDYVILCYYDGKTYNYDYSSL